MRLYGITCRRKILRHYCRNLTSPFPEQHNMQLTKNIFFSTLIYKTWIHIYIYSSIPNYLPKTRTLYVITNISRTVQQIVINDVQLLNQFSVLLLYVISFTGKNLMTRQQLMFNEILKTEKGWTAALWWIAW